MPQPRLQRGKADALLDRLLTNAHRLELKGESLRKTKKKIPQVDDRDLAK